MAKLQHFLEPVFTEQHDSKSKETKLQVYCKAEAIMKYTFTFHVVIQKQKRASSFSLTKLRHIIPGRLGGSVI